MDAQTVSKTREAGPRASSSFEAMPSRLRLNMSFNRSPQDVFGNDVDPLTIEPLRNFSVPHVQSAELSIAELVQTLDAFKFPVRTDGVRGLLWGPFKNDPETEDEEDVPSLTDGDDSSRTDSSLSGGTGDTEMMCTVPVPWTDRQRIFPILRAPLIIRIQPALKRRRGSTEDEEDQCIRAAKVERLGLEGDSSPVVGDAIVLQPISIPPRKSRITLCASSRLRYCC